MADDSEGQGPWDMVRRVAGAAIALPAVAGFVVVGIGVLLGRAVVDVAGRVLRDRGSGRPGGES